MTVLKQFTFLISTIGLIFVLTTNSHSAETVGEAAGEAAKGYSKDLVKLNMSGKKNKILKIKESLNNCLDNKCHNKTYLMWVIQRPQKLIVLNQIEELDNLLLSNEKASLLDTKKQEDILAEEKKAAEGNYKKLLVTYEKLNKDNKDLKLKIEKLLAKYEIQISKLENENKEINEKNNEMYSLLNNFQKRKLGKKNN